MQRVDLKLGFSCNNRCSFCVQGDKRATHGPRSLDRVRRDLADGLQRGARQLVLTGGEPTLYEGLFDVIRLARKLGYDGVQIQTNGRLFCYERVCRAAIEAGATEFSPALHGARADVHDGLTRAPGSFDQTVRGIENLVRLGQQVITNSVITTPNFRELAELGRTLVALGVAQFQFAYVHIVGSAAEFQDVVVPRKRDIMPHVIQGLEVGRAAGVRCLTEAIPFCLLPGYESHVAERVIPDAVVYDADHVIADHRVYRRSEGKAKGPRCGECRWDAECEGPWREYPERFGWEEFVPVTENGAT
jgi:MoaA/NifB/PqqE/SkfB family radical SAM enzyme